MTAQAGDTSATRTAAQKQLLRRRLRLQRRQLPISRRKLFERKAAQRLAALPELRRARHIAIYLAVASELSTTPLVRLLRRTRCRLYAPAVDHAGHMRFLPLLPHPRRRRDRLDLPHPGSSRGIRSPQRLDAVVVPLVGFDVRGHRLGAGGGYYDRHFAFRLQRPGRPCLIGLAFEVQRVDELPVESWDLRLDAVVTEQRVYRGRGC